MHAKTIVFLMMATLAILFFLSKYFRRYEQKISAFERFLFQKMKEQGASSEETQKEIISHGKALGLNEEKVQSLMQGMQTPK